MSNKDFVFKAQKRLQKLCVFGTSKYQIKNKLQYKEKIVMPKMKNNSSAKKRFKLKKSGLIKRNKQNRRHILTKKTPSRKRRLRKGGYVAKANERNIKELLSA